MRRLPAVLALLALAAAAAAAALVWRTFPKTRGTVRVAGHAAPVTIERDARGVPTIRAASIPDALFGLGYVHAQDRLWQMEFQRRVGSGRLAEILGEDLLPSDRFLRTIGFRRAAEKTWTNLSPEARGLVESYGRGVNAFLESDRSRPIELVILRARVEPWTPMDSLVWGKMMAWDLAGNARDEIRRERFTEALGAGRADALLPVAASEPSILTADDLPDATPGPRGSRNAGGVRRAAVPGSLESLFASLDPLGFGGESRGSNSWVLAGSRTATGMPILANDPHLGLRAPSVWYLARIDAPGYAVAGATLPGVPGVIIGHNARIAWGLTSLEPDVQDLFVEDVDPNDAARYRHAGEWKTFATRTETLRVRGRADVSFTVRESVHGPVVSDVLDGADRLGAAVALRWTGLDAGDRTAEAFLAMNRARNWTEFLEGARLLGAPAQNVVYADVEGHIGYVAAGAIPVRPRADGLRPVGGAGDDDWSGIVPFDAMPRVLDPPRGFIVTANNRVLPAGLAYPFGLTWAPPYRAARITERIGALPRLSADDVRAIQLDEVSLQARDFLTVLRDTKPLGEPSRRILDRLRDWDGAMARDSPAAAAYAAWYAALAKVADDELGDAPRRAPRSRFLLEALRDDSGWCDDAGTSPRESCAEFKSAALRDAAALLASRLGGDGARWRWDALHRARFAHGVFGGVPVLTRFFSPEAGHGGDGATPNVGAFSLDGRFAMSDGASYRQIADLADLSRSRYVHAPGQSGNVFDRRYRDLLPLWRDGRDFEIGREPPVRTLRLER